MEITLAPDTQRIIQQKVASGAYASPDEALNAAVREWEAQEADPFPIDIMRRLVAVGVEQLERGEYGPLDMQATIAAAKILLLKKRTLEERPNTRLL